MKISFTSSFNEEVFCFFFQKMGIRIHIKGGYKNEKIIYIGVGN